MKTGKTKLIFSVSVFIAALIISPICNDPVFAQKVDDGKPESMPVKVSGLIDTQYAGGQGNATSEWIKQETIPFGSGQLDVALHEKIDAIMAIKEMTVAASATGKGADFRDWNVDSIKLYIDGVAVMPDTTEKFYITKQSMFRLPAAFMFAYIGSQYEQNAQGYKSGEVCPVTGQQKTAERTGPERSDFGKTIDKAGMAAGMGLLTAQAKGEISALKCKFVVKVEDAAKLDGADDKIKVVIENKEKHQKETIEVNIPEMPQPAAKPAPKPAGKPMPDTFMSATNPETGETMTARKNADGSITITKADKDGKIISQETQASPKPRELTPEKDVGPTAASSTDAEGVTKTITQHPDGSATVTETDASGKKISEKTEPSPAGRGAASGSLVEPDTDAKIVGWTEQDGSTTVTKTYPNGSKMITKTDKAGKVISQKIEPAPKRPAPAPKAAEPAKEAPPEKAMPPAPQQPPAEKEAPPQARLPEAGSPAVGQAVPKEEAPKPTEKAPARLKKFPKVYPEPEPPLTGPMLADEDDVFEEENYGFTQEEMRRMQEFFKQNGFNLDLKKKQGGGMDRVEPPVLGEEEEEPGGSPSEWGSGEKIL